MPGKFQTQEAQGQLLVSLFASLDNSSIDYKKIHQYFGVETSVEGVKYQFRLLKKRKDEVMKWVADGGDAKAYWAANPFCKEKKTPGGVKRNFAEAYGDEDTEDLAFAEKRLRTLLPGSTERNEVTESSQNGDDDGYSSKDARSVFPVPPMPASTSCQRRPPEYTASMAAAQMALNGSSPSGQRPSASQRPGPHCMEDPVGLSKDGPDPRVVQQQRSQHPGFTGGGFGGFGNPQQGRSLAQPESRETSIGRMVDSLKEELPAQSKSFDTSPSSDHSSLPRAHLNGVSHSDYVYPPDQFGVISAARTDAVPVTENPYSQTKALSDDQECPSDEFEGEVLGHEWTGPERGSHRGVPVVETCPGPGCRHSDPLSAQQEPPSTRQTPSTSSVQTEKQIHQNVDQAPHDQEQTQEILYSQTQALFDDQESPSGDLLWGVIGHEWMGPERGSHQGVPVVESCPGPDCRHSHPHSAQQEPPPTRQTPNTSLSKTEEKNLQNVDLTPYSREQFQEILYSQTQALSNDQEYPSDDLCKEVLLAELQRLEAESV